MDKSVVVGSVIPESRIGRLLPEGYVQHVGAGFVKNWVLHALDDNPELIDAVIRCNHAEADVRNPAEGCEIETAAFWGMHLTGLACCYRTFAGEELLAEGNKLVDRIYEARGADGYFSSHLPDDRFGGQTGGDNNNNWDVWGFYQGVIGLVSWYRASGSSKALRMAMDGADLCISHFSDRPYSFGFSGVWTSMGHPYAVLYKETGEPRYLAEALRILENEWPVQNNWRLEISEGKECFQFSHNRWESLHSLMLLGILYEITRKNEYLDDVAFIWRSIRDLERHNTGAVTSGEKFVGSPYRGGAVENCCSIAWIAFSTDYLRYSLESCVADEIELTYYNAILGAVMADRREVSYDNPMEGYRVRAQVQLMYNYNASAPDMNCCQANSCRGIGELFSWASMTDNRCLYLNYYGPCAMQTKTPGGQSVTLRIRSDYPADGNILIEIDELKIPEQFILCLRIPCWSEKSTVVLNYDAGQDVLTGRYHRINREWKTGDRVSLILDMSVHFWSGKERFTGRTSVYYGPLLMAYDLEMNHHRILPDTVLSADALRKSIPAAGDGDRHWVILDVMTTRGDPVRLVDYASAGKTGSFYTTWHRLDQAPSDSFIPREGCPVWTER